MNRTPAINMGANATCKGKCPNEVQQTKYECCTCATMSKTSNIQCEKCRLERNPSWVKAMNTAKAPVTQQPTRTYTNNAYDNKAGPYADNFAKNPINGSSANNFDAGGVRDNCGYTSNVCAANGKPKYS